MVEASGKKNPTKNIFVNILVVTFQASYQETPKSN